MQTRLSYARFIQLLYLSLFATFFVLNHTTSAQNIREGRISFYPFNGNAQDQQGTNHGTVYGAQPAPDRFGNPNSAFYFDGIKDFIAIPDHPSINFAANEDFSVSVWIKIAPEQNDMGGNNNEILGKWNTLITSSYPYAIRYWNSLASASNKEKIFALRYDSRYCQNNPLTNSSCIITSDNWHHIVFSKKGSKISLFQDGIFQESVTDNTTLTCDTKNSNPIYVGKRDTDRRYFTGLIDDISFYNRALTNTEVKILFEEGEWTGQSIRTDLLSFSIPGQNSTTIIDTDKRTVSVEMPCGTDLKKLTADFAVSEGATAFVGDTKQYSGITANDFAQPLIYTIVGEDGCTSQDWEVRVHQETLSPQEAEDRTTFLSFSLPEQTKPTLIDYDQHNIIVELRCNASFSNLVASFSLAKKATAKVGGVLQKNGTTANDFTEPVIYQVSDHETCAWQYWTILVQKQQTNTEAIDTSTKEFFIPNVITPNNDGLNDTFQVGQFFLGSELTIFNRHGKMVSHFSSYENQFSGEGLSPGTYFYYLLNPCIQGKIKGDLLIIK
jgi:gliding motility-associated-like protein